MIRSMAVRIELAEGVNMPKTMETGQWFTTQAKQVVTLCGVHSEMDGCLQKGPGSSAGFSDAGSPMEAMHRKEENLMAAVVVRSNKPRA